MAFESQENQLELFDLRNSSAPKVRRESLGRILLQLRYDQLVLGSMAAILGVTVIFACGVERGKLLVRSERSMLVRQSSASAPSETVKAPGTPSKPSATAELPAALQPAPAAVLSTVAVKKTTEKPAQAPGPKAKTRVVSAPAPGKSRYAVQVVTFTQATAAKREMDRLHARGERAFLVMGNGRTIVYVGPFPSKSNAVEKVSTLKSRYQDCFVRTL